MNNIGNAAAKKIKVIDIRDKLSKKQQQVEDKFLEENNFLVENKSLGENNSLVENNLLEDVQEEEDDFNDFTQQNQGGADEEDEDEEEEDEDEDDLDGGGSTASTSSTTRMLSEDPLFLVLSEYLVNKKGENIVTVLDKINTNLSKLLKYLKD